MKVIPTELPGVLLVDPVVFPDERGYFLETWSEPRYAEAGLSVRFVQDNLSFSQRGVLRGLHFQEPFAQGKLVSVVWGEVFDVVVDIRLGSPTFGRWMGYTLSAASARQLYIPEGFAHGFLVTSDEALFAYKCTRPYHPEAEITLLWSDPDLGIDWPIDSPVVSVKDGSGLRLRDVARERLPRYR